MRLLNMNTTAAAVAGYATFLAETSILAEPPILAEPTMLAEPLVAPFVPVEDPGRVAAFTTAAPAAAAVWRLGLARKLAFGSVLGQSMLDYIWCISSSLGTVHGVLHQHIVRIQSQDRGLDAQTIHDKCHSYLDIYAVGDGTQ
jgi:hypothetical protein